MPIPYRLVLSQDLGEFDNSSLYYIKKFQKGSNYFKKVRKLTDLKGLPYWSLDQLKPFHSPSAMWMFFQDKDYKSNLVSDLKGFRSFRNNYYNNLELDPSKADINFPNSNGNFFDDLNSDPLTFSGDVNSVIDDTVESILDKPNNASAFSIPDFKNKFFLRIQGNAVSFNPVVPSIDFNINAFNLDLAKNKKTLELIYDNYKKDVCFSDVTLDLINYPKKASDSWTAKTKKLMEDLDYYKACQFELFSKDYLSGSELFLNSSNNVPIVFPNVIKIVTITETGLVKIHYTFCGNINDIGFVKRTIQLFIENRLYWKYVNSFSDYYFFKKNLFSISSFFR